MSMKPEEMRLAFARRLASFADVDDRAASAARDVLPSLVSLLVDRFGARRVVLFGSLVRGVFRVDSDIDLAVEGIPGSSFMTALAEATGRAGRPVDLIDLEWVDRSLRECIERDGEVLYVAR